MIHFSADDVLLHKREQQCCNETSINLAQPEVKWAITLKYCCFLVNY